MEEMQPSQEVSGDIHERFDNWLAADEPAEEAEGSDEQTEIEAKETESENDQPEAEDEDEDSGDDLEVLTIDGEEIALPKEVAEKVTKIQKRLEADYTRKTQEAAEMRKSAEQLQQRVQQDAAFNQQNTDLLVEWKSLDMQIKEYDEVDWAALAEQDIGAYSKHKEIRDNLRLQQQKVGQEFGNRQQFIESQKAEEHKKQLEYTIATVRKAIPTYDKATDDKAVQTAVKLGEKYGIKVDPQLLSQTRDPLVWIGLVELSKYMDIVDKRPATNKQVASAPKITKSVANTQKPSQQSRDQKIQKLLSQGRIREAALL